jgi:hypothetical protein
MMTGSLLRCQQSGPLRALELIRLAEHQLGSTRAGKLACASPKRDLGNIQKFKTHTEYSQEECTSRKFSSVLCLMCDTPYYCSFDGFPHVRCGGARYAHFTHIPGGSITLRTPNHVRSFCLYLFVQSVRQMLQHHHTSPDFFAATIGMFCRI